MLHGGNNGLWIEADRLGQLDELDNVEPPLAAFKTGNPRLRSLEFFGELNLPDASFFPLSNHKFYQPFMALAANGFHLSEYAESAN